MATATAQAVQYDQSYLDLMKSRNYDATAEAINRARWEFMACVDMRTVLDYGCGLGYLAQFAPPGVVVDTFDIAPVEQTGIQHERYDCVCFFDVLEHVPDFRALDDLFARTDFVCVSVPMLPLGAAMGAWKHNKFASGEHLHYFTRDSLELFMAVRGFERLREGRPEEPIRQDIYTALFRRVGVPVDAGV
ncbi:MAG: methyltransferase domain-containing protein [Anaerovoracaceae bacterium]